MKKACFFLAMFAMFSYVAPVITHSNDVKAQIVTKVPLKTAAGVTHDTTTNRDTLWAAVPVDNISRAIRVTAKKLSGNPAGIKVVLQGSYGDATSPYVSSMSDGYWDGIDSVTFTNVTWNKKVFDLRTASNNLLYNKYRIYTIIDTASTGVQSSVLKVSHLRRSN